VAYLKFRVKIQFKLLLVLWEEERGRKASLGVRQARSSLDSNQIAVLEPLRQCPVSVTTAFHQYWVGTHTGSARLKPYQ